MLQDPTDWPQHGQAEDAAVLPAECPACEFKVPRVRSVAVLTLEQWTHSGEQRSVLERLRL